MRKPTRLVAERCFVEYVCQSGSYQSQILGPRQSLAKVNGEARK